jgi:YbbR domain-containing protein
MKSKIQNRLTTLLTENILLKVVSISCALTLWTWVQNQTVEEISLKALITYTYPEDLSIVNIPRQSVTVLLEGPQVLVKGIKNASLEVDLDSSDAAKGTTSYELTTSSISNIPAGFRVLRISPPSIDIELDTPIREWNISPPNITLQGATKIVSNMDTIKTEVINIDNSRGSMTKSVEIIQPPSLSLNNESIYVNVQMNIDTVFQTERFANIPILIRNQNWSVEPKYATISIQGAAKDLENLRAEQITILVENIKMQEGPIEMNLIEENTEKESEEKDSLPDISAIFPNSNLMRYTIQDPPTIILQKAATP